MHIVCIFMSLGKADLSRPCWEPRHCAPELETAEDFEDQLAQHDSSPEAGPKGGPCLLRHAAIVAATGVWDLHRGGDLRRNCVLGCFGSQLPNQCTQGHVFDAPEVTQAHSTPPVIDTRLGVP